jgi:tetratricopeptide (TPR) repeat protein
MKNTTLLTKKAIDAARQQNWAQAIDLNKDILKEEPRNTSALNRLALARMQLGHVQIAQKILKQILEFDKRNKIALKNLQKIKKKEKNQSVKFNHKSVYIEEPGRAKVVSLSHLANNKILNSLGIGQACQLVPKKKLISVNDAESGQYLGILPQAISQRLMKLIKNGNEYNCHIHSVSSEQCRIHIKVAKISENNRDIASFPVNQTKSVADPNELAAEFQVRNNIPVEIVNTDTDKEPVKNNFNDVIGE